MKRAFRARNFVLLVLLSLTLWHVEFAFRKNNVCPVEDHAIQSELDAIDVAKKKVVKHSFFSSDRFGSAHEFVESLSETENCCSAERTRRGFGVIVWSVYLNAKATAKIQSPHHICRDVELRSDFSRFFIQGCSGAQGIKWLEIKSG